MRIDRKHSYKKGFRSLLTILLCTVLFMNPVLAAHAEENADSTTSELYALSAVLMDADNGRILVEKNGGEVLAMASTTKIMTCILTLEQADLNDMVSVSGYAAGMPKVRLGALKGEVFRLEDLLYSLMLESHNDSAAIIAEHIGNRLKQSDKRSADNSREESESAVLAFAGLMNEKARQIGCENTYFVTPNGLDGTYTYTDDSGEEIVRQHSTTASDLARIMSYCITDSPAKDQFLTITRTAQYGFGSYKLDDQNNWAASGRTFSCNNHNAFLNMMDGALTGKTGFTGKAGYCYVGALRKDDKTFVIALLACGWPNHKTWKWHDAKLLFDYALGAYEKKDIYEPVEFSPVPVLNGIEDSTRFAVDQKPISLLLSGADQVRMELDVPDTLTAPVAEGEVVGSEKYYVNGKLYEELPIYNTRTIPEITYTYCLKKIWMLFLQ